MARKDTAPQDATVPDREAARMIGRLVAKLERLEGESELTRAARELTRAARELAGGVDIATRPLAVNEARRPPAAPLGALCTQGGHPSPGLPAIAVSRSDGGVAFCVNCLLRESAKGNREAPRVRMIREDYNGDA